MKRVQPFIVPIVGALAFLLHHSTHQNWTLFFCIPALIAIVLGAVHHAEIISIKVGEPFGALVLALAITIIEVSIIVSLMLAGGEDTSTLARDTVFAALMIILTGMLGLTLLVGGIKFKEQDFSAKGATSILTVLITIGCLTLILPNFSDKVPGPYYSAGELLFVACATLTLYFSFLFVQNFRHRNHFLTASEIKDEHEMPSSKQVTLSIILLPISLLLVVLLSEGLAPNLDELISYLHAPKSLSGIIIACVILLPEGISAYKAAANNQMQQSLNLSLGSALASISLTIPIVAVISLFLELPLALGIDPQSSVLFFLSMIVVILSLGKGSTTILQGIVLLLLFFVYLFISF